MIFWLRIARESGSTDGASRVVEKITDRFWLLARYPHLGRSRAEGLRSFPAEDYIIIHRIEEGGVVIILHVVHGSRDVQALFRY